MSSYPSTSTAVHVPAGTPSGTLFVDVGKTCGKGLVDPNTNLPVSLEDCARGFWKNTHLAGAHASQCDWLVARMNGIIQGVWKIDRKIGWQLPTVSPIPTRIGNSDTTRSVCVLLPDDEEVEDVRKKLVGSRVHLGRNHNSLRGYFIS